MIVPLTIIQILLHLIYKKVALCIQALSHMDLQQLLVVIPKQIEVWTTVDVSAWLRFINLSKFVSVFEINKIGGPQLLEVTEGRLKMELGVKSNIQCKKIINWVNFLKNNLEYYTDLTWQLRQRELSQEYQQQPQTSEEQSLVTRTFASFANQAVQKEPLQKMTSTQKYIQHHLNLFIYQRFNQSTQYYCCNNGLNLSIGRASDNNIIIIDHGIENYHCKIVHKQGQHYLNPIYSMTGVWTKIKSRMRIEKVQVIQMGFTQFQVSQDGDILVVRVLQSINIDVRRKYQYSPYFTREVRLGRGAAQHLSFPFDTTMSSKHGKFIFSDGAWYYEDIEATNGYNYLKYSSWLRCLTDTKITNKTTFRVGRTIYIFDCSLKEQQQDGIASRSSAVSKGICKICKISQKNSYFTPCSHSIACLDCGQQSTKCHQCNQTIIKVNRIYRT